MKSHEIMKEVLSGPGVKSIAADMHLSTSLLYKWSQDQDTEDSSGADSPLDRLVKLYEITGDDRLVRWLCEKADGFYSPNPRPSKERPPLLQATQAILREFSEMLEAVSSSIADDGNIDVTEAVSIRKEWEDLKSLTESFVSACERGGYQPQS
ncbi:MAG: hypothetical protein ACI9TH_002813 [Kiritimatiellia bacterium]|jgi:hypothetical protein